MKTAFETELAKNIKGAIRKMKRDGVVGMGMRNLLGVTPTPAHTLQGAPNGTNCQYYYAQMFERIANDVAKGFVYPQP
jgi:hypothetical protein